MRGNNNKVPIIISFVILVDELIYAGYIYSFSSGKGNAKSGRILYFLSINLFSLVHWFIACLYYECASINPFVRHDPKEVKK
jgi:hypothetical protein